MGTNAPGATLHVKAPGDGQVALFEASGSTAGQMEIHGGNSSQMMIRTLKSGTDLKFTTRSPSLDDQNDYQIYLDSIYGNVGIGTNNINAKLSVNG